MGSTRVIFDSSGALYQWTSYEPFGKTVPGNPETDRLSWIGKEKDEESDLGDFGVRKYDNETGRFLSTDPLWEEQRPQNVYHYSDNNPIVYKDPDGKFLNFAAAGVGAVVGGLIGGGIEAGKQLWTSGKVNNWAAVGGASAKGAIIGGVAGLTGGASIAVQASAGAIAGAAGTIVDKAVQGQKATGRQIVIGLASGAAGGAAGAYVGNAVRQSTEKAAIVATVVGGKAQGEAIKTITNVVANQAAKRAAAASTVVSKVLEAVIPNREASKQNNSKNEKEKNVSNNKSNTGQSGNTGRKK